MVHVEYSCQLESVLTYEEMKSTYLQETYMFDEGTLIIILSHIHMPVKVDFYRFIV